MGADLVEQSERMLVTTLRLDPGFTHQEERLYSWREQWWHGLVVALALVCTVDNRHSCPTRRGADPLGTCHTWQL
ncbi:MAG: hypothetical protein DLM62_04965 [Pseudonocardiales bacterium]|nr:MAG: hypothetical protein DLM62_04965 [Pseudonocardiales bacterium]